MTAVKETGRIHQQSNWTVANRKRAHTFVHQSILRLRPFLISYRSNESVQDYLERLLVAIGLPTNAEPSSNPVYTAYLRSESELFEV